MSLILLEGMDRVGKSTVAEYFRQREKYEYVHMTAPAAWHTRDTYFAEMLHMIALTAGKKVVMDRTWWGELIWPKAYNRRALLSAADCHILTRVAESLHLHDVNLIYMHDDDTEAHKRRLKAHKEPSYDYELVHKLYQEVARQGFFDSFTLPQAEARGWKV